MLDETGVPEPSAFVPLRMVAQGRRAAAELNVFGELVEPEDDRRKASPCRSIPVTEAMRKADAARQRQVAARPDWALKRELRAENLIGSKPAVVLPGRVAEKPERQRIAAPPPRAQAKSNTGRHPIPKKCQWCGVEVAGYKPHRQHEQTCPKRVRLLRARAPRPRKPAELPKPEALRLPCLGGCGRWVSNRARRRPDGLCSQCGGREDRKAERRRAMRMCLTCGKLLRRGTIEPNCREHQPKTIWLKSGTAEEYALNEAWAALSFEDKAVVMESLAAEGNA